MALLGRPDAASGAAAGDRLRRRRLYGAALHRQRHARRARERRAASAAGAVVAIARRIAAAGRSRCRARRSRPRRSSTTRSTYRAGPYNQFFVRAAVNGVVLPFIIDTGAFMVSLRREEMPSSSASMSGALHWDLAISTANGNAYAARVTLALGAARPHHRIQRAGDGDAAEDRQPVAARHVVPLAPQILADPRRRADHPLLAEHRRAPNLGARPSREAAFLKRLRKTPPP